MRFGSMLIFLALFVLSISGVATAAGKSTTTITGSFSDSCRDLAVQSGKDISHVEIRFVDGRVVKDETVNSREFSIDGESGDEIDVAIVKSGTTRQTLTCPRSNDPPTAVLEIATPPLAGCTYFPFPEYPTCLADESRTDWSRQADGTIAFLILAPYPEASRTFSFRGSSSTDPDGDIASWSIDFGDGTSISGGWAADPPTDVAHPYSEAALFSGRPTIITLNVMDAAGHSDTETMSIVVIDITPD